MAWNPYDQPVDHILLSGQKSPGLADVDGAAMVRKWDERQGYGLSGSTIVYTGDGLAKFSVRLRLYTPEHFEAWGQWKTQVGLLETTRGRRTPPKPRDIWHPHLEELGIKSVVVEEVSQLKQTDDGEWTVEIKFIQHRPPLPIPLMKAEGSEAKPPVDPNTLEGKIAYLSSAAQLEAAGNSELADFFRHKAGF